jgi:hypothetical protein
VHGANCTTRTFTEQAIIFRTLIRQNSTLQPRKATWAARPYATFKTLCMARIAGHSPAFLMNIAVKEMGQNIFVENTLQMPYLGA